MLEQLQAGGDTCFEGLACIPEHTEMVSGPDQSGTKRGRAAVSQKGAIGHVLLCWCSRWAVPALYIHRQYISKPRFPCEQDPAVRIEAYVVLFWENVGATWGKWSD